MTYLSVNNTVKEVITGMDTATISKERRQNLIDALSFKEPKKVPIGAEVLSWPLAYAGVRYDDVIDDPPTIAREYVRFLDIIELDFIMGGFLSQPLKALHALGNYSFRTGDDGTTLIHLQPEIDFMSAEEYPELIIDLVKFKEKTIKRRYPVFSLPKADAYEKVKDALCELDKWSTANNLISQYITKEKGIIPITGAPIGFASPLTSLFDKFRGMKETLLDLRRRPDMLRAACNALFEPMKARISLLNPTDFSSPYPLATTVYHVECFISPSQFDEFFFDPFMELMMPFMEAGLKFFVKGEGRFLNTIDRYRKLPKGAVVFMLDEDDPFEAYKAIGDWQSIATGITADLLKVGTKEQCTDFVKKCFDVFAPGGGFIFMQNKPLLCATDAKTENLIAVYETANELSLA